MTSNAVVCLAAMLVSTLGSPNPPPPAPPTPAKGHTESGLDAAQSAYRAGRLVDAAVGFDEAASSNEAASSIPAKLGLAKAMYKLGFHAVARSLLLDVTDPGSSPAVRRAALPWVVAVLRQLDPDTALLRRLASYRAADLEIAAFDEIQDELAYQVGRAHYRAGELERALSWLDDVPPESSFWVPAQYLTGVAHTRLWHGPPAIDAFKNVLRRQIDLRRSLGKRKLRRVRRFARRRARLERRGWKRAIERLDARMARRDVTLADVEELEQAARFDAMASVAMGYVFYQAGKFDLALKYFRRVPQSSPWWLDAIFGQAWTEFLLAYVDTEAANAHYQRALGHVHTIHAPFFPYRLYPEAPLLQAEVYYFNCRYRSTQLALDDFERRYAAKKRRLQQLLDQFPEDFALFETYREVRRSSSSLDESATRMLEGLLADEELADLARRVDEIEAERARLERSPAGLRTGPLGDRIAEELDLALSIAREETGAAVRTRLAGAVSEIARREREALKIRYELAPHLAELPGESTEPQRIQVGPDEERYAYNGEYWQDELGNYAYRVTSLCRDR